MQMYRVKFARQINDSSVDIGDTLVVASSREDALMRVIQIMGLPAASTTFDIARVKPSFFQVARRTVDNSIAASDGTVVSKSAACVATFPGVTESREQRDWYSLNVSADISAPNENEAIAMLSRAISREIGGVKQKRSTRNLEIACDRAALRPRIAAVDDNALFKVRRIFQGGDART